MSVDGYRRRCGHHRAAGFQRAYGSVIAAAVSGTWYQALDCAGCVRRAGRCWLQGALLRSAVRCEWIFGSSVRWR